MASPTPTVIHEEDLHIKRADGTGKGLEDAKAAMIGRRKALTDRPQAQKAIKVKSIAPTPLETILTDEEIAKCHEWANEGIEHMHFSGNDMLKFEAQQQEERVRKKVDKAMGGLRAWKDMTFGLEIPVKEIPLDTEDILELKFEPEVLPHSPRASVCSKSVNEGIEDLFELDYYNLFDIQYEIKLKEEGIESLPVILNRHYATMQDLDKSLQGDQRQNEQRCEQEVEEIRRGIESGDITPGTSHIKFSDEALEEQKHCVRIADEKVTLPTPVYDLVDEQICLLDQYMKKPEGLRQERELAASGGSSALNSDGITRSARSTESSRGGREKTKLVTPTEQPSADFELPVDPNEPTYCICNQVSWGKMIACDNPDCKIEWFHFQCVGLKEHPKGKWYCSSCVGFKRTSKRHDCELASAHL